MKKIRERIQINTIRNERGETTTDTTEIQRVLRNYYKKTICEKFENLGEMDKFLEKYTVFPNARGSFSKIDHKISLNEFQKMKSYQVFSQVTVT